jgi:hypothetical protein
MKVVGIHGIAHEFLGAPDLESAWFKSLQGGLEIAGHPRIDRGDFRSVFYGDIFRPDGVRSSGVLQSSAQNDEDAIWEQELLMQWWQEAARLSMENRVINDPKGEDPNIQNPVISGSRGRMPEAAQKMLLKWMAKSRFFSKVEPGKIPMFPSQVRKFLCDLDVKQSVLKRVSDKVSPNDTRVIIGHSLGSVVAYEALCANPEWKIHTLITLGSPLGTPGLIFDRLTPRPKDGSGVWPNVQRWINIADKGDFVALRKNLKDLFSPNDEKAIIDHVIYNGWESHSALRYLTSRQAGDAIANGLNG